MADQISLFPEVKEPPSEATGAPGKNSSRETSSGEAFPADTTANRGAERSENKRPAGDSPAGSTSETTDKAEGKNSQALLKRTVRATEGDAKSEAEKAIQQAKRSRAASEKSGRETPIGGILVEVLPGDDVTEVLVKMLVARKWKSIRSVRNDFFGPVQNVPHERRKSPKIGYCEGCGRVQRHARLESSKKANTGVALDVTCLSCGTVAKRIVETQGPR